jgi:predicted membrane-bound mannosyltransferase
MRFQSLILAFVVVAGSICAQQSSAPQDGTLLQMNSVACDASDNAAGGPVLSSAAEQTRTQPTVCAEYVIQTEQLIYTVRPKNSKYAVLLPLGERGQFRLIENEMLLRVSALDNKEREFIIVSTKSRTEQPADLHRIRLNHLQ